MYEEGRAADAGAERAATPAHTGDPELFSKGALSIDDVKRLGALSGKLAGEYRDETIAWVRGAKIDSTACDVGAAVAALNAVTLPESPNLPYNLFRAYLLEEAGAANARSAAAFANILQESVDIKSTGPEMGDMVLLYYALGLKVNFAQLGFEMNEPLASYIGGMLASGFGRMPDWSDYESNTGHYIGWAIIVAENMGDKTTGRRDAKVTRAGAARGPGDKGAHPGPQVHAGAPRGALRPLDVDDRALGDARLLVQYRLRGDAQRQSGVRVQDMVQGRLDVPDTRGTASGRRQRQRHVRQGNRVQARGGLPPHRRRLGARQDGAGGESRRPVRKIGSKMYAVDGVRPFVTPRFDAGKLSKLGITVIPLREKGVALHLLDQQWQGYDGIHGGTFLHKFYAKEFLKWYAAKEQEARQAE